AILWPRSRHAPGGKAMGWVTDRATMLVLVVALGIGPWGCAHTKPRAAQPPSDDVRSELGTIGVAPASGAPPAPLMAPTRGKAAGALKGAGGGFVAGRSEEHTSELQSL